MSTGNPVYEFQEYQFAPTGSDPVLPPPDPAVLAAEVRNTLPVPPPSATWSPDLAANVDPAIGLPVTYVNLWFWAWTTPDTWRVLSQSTSLRGVVVTVTVAPVALIFDPGNGDQSVQCAGPGRAWSASDADADPNAVDGCGYRYTVVSSSPSAAITARTTIVWHVSWTSNIGENGELNPLYTFRDTVPFAVEQIQVVGR